MSRLLDRAVNAAAERHPVNNSRTTFTSWPYATWWQRLLAPVIGHCCPDCGVAPSTRHRDGCTTGSWDGGTWA